MAVSTPVLQATISSGDITSSYTTPSFSPSSGDLLLVAMHPDFDSGGILTPTITTTLANVGSWTQIKQDAHASSFKGNCVIWAYAKITGTPGTGTITFDFGTGNNRDMFVAKVYTVTGYNMTTPVAAATAAASEYSGGAQPTFASATFAGTPATDSLIMVCAALIDFSGAMSPDADYTELDDLTTNNPTYGFDVRTEVQYRNGNADTGISATWGGTNRNWIILGIQVQAASAATIEATMSGAWGGLTGTITATVETPGGPTPADGPIKHRESAVFVDNDVYVRQSGVWQRVDVMYRRESGQWVRYM